MIGDLRTDALHRALQDNAFSDQTLIGLLILALAAKNVSVQGPNETGAWDRQALGAKIAQGGVLTADDGLLRQTAREMLVAVLSCRDNMSNSGVVACVAGSRRSMPSPTCRTWQPRSSSPACRGRHSNARPQRKGSGWKSA